MSQLNNSQNPQAVQLHKACIEYLLQPVNTLNSVGAVTTRQLSTLLNPVPHGAEINLLSLLLHFPTKTVRIKIVNQLTELLNNSADKNRQASLLDNEGFYENTVDEVQPFDRDEVIVRTCMVKVVAHYPNFARGNRRLPYRIIVVDSHNNNAELTFYGNNFGWLKQALPIDKLIFVAGKAAYFGSKLTISHPQLIESERLKNSDNTSFHYPLTEGLSQKKLITLISSALSELKSIIAKYEKSPNHHSDISETNQTSMPSSYKNYSFIDALIDVHNPSGSSAFDKSNPQFSRIVYEILFADQLVIAQNRQQKVIEQGIAKIPLNSERNQSIPISYDNSVQFEMNLFDNQPNAATNKTYEAKDTLTNDSNCKTVNKAFDALEFDLTSAQERAINEICEDLASPIKMVRLLQGDVGSGKTAVAWVTMVHAVASGFQAVLLAPTTILANQHYKYLSKLCDKTSIKAVYLSQQLGAKDTKASLEAIRNGDANIIVGTHAVFQKSIEYHNLGYAVIDEQHRFGVEQRLMLSDKGESVDTLLMSATPIPRSLAMTKYGDTEISILDEKPKGRQNIITSMCKQSKIDGVISLVLKALQKNKQVYWVCPAIEENEQLAIAAVEVRAENLKEHIPADQIQLLHGDMKPAEQNTARINFESNQKNVLVATTMVEVGVDVPNAILMIIESAERFGLAQLHQLRGRVGRSTSGPQSQCILLHSDGLSKTAFQRLKIITECQDGFIIANKDFNLRGAGELLGTKQSGAPYPWLYDPQAHEDILVNAHINARKLINSDPKLSSDASKYAKITLQLAKTKRDSNIMLSG